VNNIEFKNENVINANLRFRFLFLASAITLALTKLTNITDMHASTISLSFANLTQKGQSEFRSD